MPEEKKIWLTIHGRQTNAEGEAQEVELITEGSIRREGGSTLLTYTESEIVGTDGSTMVIELIDETVKILRSGGYGMNFEFLEGQRCLTLYSTPYGVMEMRALPVIVKYGVGEASGDIELLYELEMQGQPLGSNHLRMHWREEAGPS